MYGPPPTRTGGAGGEMITCACPMPGRRSAARARAQAARALAARSPERRGAAGGWPRAPAAGRRRWRSRRHNDGSRDRRGTWRGRHRDAAGTERAPGAEARGLVRRGCRRWLPASSGAAMSGGGSADAEVLLRSDVNRPEIQFGQLLRAHDPGRQQHDDFGLLAADLVAREDLPEERQMDRAGKSLVTLFMSRCCISPARRLDSPSRRRRRVVSVRWTKDGTVTPATGYVRADGAVVQDQVEDDLAVERDARRHVDVDADVLVGIRAQRVHARAAGRNRRVAGRHDRNPLSRASATACCPPRPRSCGFATILVWASVSRNRTMAVGTAR